MTYDPKKHGANCEACPRKKQKPVAPEGPQGARWVWLGSEPSIAEVQRGTFFVGPGGTLLSRMWANATAEAGVIVPRGQIWRTSAVLCLPIVRGDKEGAAAMACCRPRLAQELAAVHPDAAILALGKWAAAALFGTVKKLGAWQGFFVQLNQPRQDTPADLRKRDAK